MVKPPENTAETLRLEQLWTGEFGNDYTARNRDAGESRAAFWQTVLTEFPLRNALEVGCNVGANLRWVAQHLPTHGTYGVDINLKALGELHSNLPEVNALWSPARSLPFRDRLFDMVFTMGVLIHQPESTLPLVMNEIVRCSKRYVLCGEYHADQLTEVSYRQQQGALFKRDYGRIYQELFPELQLRKQGFLGRDDGWDDVTYWVFERL